MKIFLDTANINEIRKGVATGSVYGVTTNPSIICKENKSLKACVGEISAISPDLTILVEAVSTDPDEMVKEARELVKLAPKIVVKIPMTLSGLFATKILSNEGISVAVTLVFSLNQAIAASCAGADYVAPFVGRLDDINANGLSLVKSIKNTFNIQGAKTQVIAASIRTPQSVAQLFAEGCDIVTMPVNILEAMLKHPLTESGLRKFEEDWKKVPIV
jgi:transaldolase